MSRPILVTRRGTDPFVVRGLQGDLQPCADEAHVERVVAFFGAVPDWTSPTRHADGRTSWPLMALSSRDALRAALDEIDTELTGVIRRHDALLEARGALATLLADEITPAEWVDE